MQTEKNRRQTTGFYVTVGDRCVNMLCWVSKGISLFFSFFLSPSLFFVFFLLFFYSLKIFLGAATEIAGMS